MTPLNDDLARFVREFRGREFRHCDELIAGIESGTVTLHSVSEHTTHRLSGLLRVFERRQRHLTRLLECEESQYRRAVLDATSELCDGLREYSDDVCDFWLFDHVTGGTTCVYVAHRSRTIVGCVSSVLGIDPED